MKRLIAVMVLTSATATQWARADLIQYQISGVGEGTLGNTFFFQVPFTVSAVADTSQIEQVDSQTFQVQALPGAQISVPGFGAGTLSGPVYIWAINEINAGRWGISGQNITTGEWDDLASMDSFDASVAAYDLRTPIGPYHGHALVTWGVGPFATSAGDFNLYFWSTAVFQSIAVPEPALPSLLALCAVTTMFKRLQLRQTR